MNRRQFFRALLGAPLTLALPGVAAAQNEGGGVVAQGELMEAPGVADVVWPAITYHTEVLMEHDNRIARLEGLVHESRPMPEARGAV